MSLMPTIKSSGEGHVEETSTDTKADGDALSEKPKAPLEKSAKELDELLAKQHPDWKDKCGLVQVTRLMGSHSLQAGPSTLAAQTARAGTFRS